MMTKEIMAEVLAAETGLPLSDLLDMRADELDGMLWDYPDASLDASEGDDELTTVLAFAGRHVCENELTHGITMAELLDEPRTEQTPREFFAQLEAEERQRDR